MVKKLLTIEKDGTEGLEGKANFLPLCLIIASFGPYVSLTLGLRTESVVIFSLFPVALANLLIRKTNTILSYPPLSLLLVLWIFVTLWTLGSTFIDGIKYTSFKRMLGYLEHYARFIAVIFVMGVFIKPSSLTEAKKLFYNACKILILLLAVNACVVVLSLFFDTSIILDYFQAPQIDEWNVAIASKQMGRFTGIFNQPMECGLVYSIGLFTWVYIVAEKFSITMNDSFLLFLLFVGGVLSVSKVFIFGGLPLFFIYLIWTMKAKNLVKFRYIFWAIPALLISLFLVDKWDEIGGLNYLLRFYTGYINLSLLTAGRFGEDEGILDSFAYVWNEAPINGLGFAYQTTLDNAYYEFFLQGGLVGLILYILILSSIGLTVLNNYRKHSEGKFLLILFVLILGAGIGAPVLTLNRVSTICCVFIMLTYFIFYLYKKRPF